MNTYKSKHKLRSKCLRDLLKYGNYGEGSQQSPGVISFSFFLTSHSCCLMNTVGYSQDMNEIFLMNILNLKFLKSKIKKDENLFFQAKEVTNTFIADEYF